MYKRSTKIADLNLLLTVFIVLLHSLYNPLRLSSESGMYTWIYVFLKTLFDVAVPTFFFISSFLFFRYLDFERIKSKIKSRFKSLIVPYVIFSVVFEKSIPYYLYRMISPFLFIPISVNILKLNKIRIHEYTFFVFMIHYVVIRIVSYIFPHEITIFLAFLRPCIILFICFIIAWCLKFVLNNKLWKLLNGSR